MERFSNSAQFFQRGGHCGVLYQFLRVGQNRLPVPGQKFQLQKGFYRGNSLPRGQFREGVETPGADMGQETPPRRLRNAAGVKQAADKAHMPRFQRPERPRRAHIFRRFARFVPRRL